MPKTKTLVIVESPAKAKTLEKFLGKDFHVQACAGHVRDLPAKSLGVKVDKDFEPTYQVIKGKEKIIKALKSEANKSTQVLLAPDPDREGEAIAWHLQALLDATKKIKRIEFNEITKEAVQRAVSHPREIDMHRVNAQQARRILDRLVGYKLSPLLWKKVRKGLSAGRVQSVAVRLICEREEEIKAFKAEEYWTVTADLKTEKEQGLKASLIAKDGTPFGVRPQEKGTVIKNQAEADHVLSDLKNAAFLVKDITQKEQKRHPAPPFITSTLQQEAARKLGYSAKRTMIVAQGLYEAGLISYMRTDSVRISNEALAAARGYIDESFGKDYLPATPLTYKSKKQAQDAHEAIRPTAITKTPESLKKDLKPEEYKLYDLIWKRFLACQMTSAVFDQTSIDIEAQNYLLRAVGSVLKFDGFMRLYLESVDDEEATQEAKGLLPQVTIGEKLGLQSILPEQHFTQPPPRYNDASLVKELEKRGIGRPSTYAPIISTIQDRGYVEKEGKALKPTEIGMVTNGLLVKNFPVVLDITFTAKMEDALDDIAAGEKEWVPTLKDFYGPFSSALAEAEVKMEKVKKEVKTGEMCPECGKELLIRQGRYGDFMACSGYPKCKYTKPLKNEEHPSNEKCEKCDSPMVYKQSRYGGFLACSGYPKCKNIKPILKKIGVPCPKCDGELVQRKSRRGKIFYSCSNYPKCDFATWQKPEVKGETLPAGE